MTEVPLKCSCGAVEGVANNISANSGTRVVCYCDDCQAFARSLKCADKILDEYGGTDIFQITPSQVKIMKGVEQIRCMRLTSKGLFRWYTECCQTPIGNTVSSGVPIIGMIHNFMDDNGTREANLGPIRGHLHVKFAKESLPVELKNSGFPYRIIMRTLSKMIMWKLKGLSNPSPFFDSSGNPVSEPKILKITTIK
jgi:hypothetical protein